VTLPSAEGLRSAVGVRDHIMLLDWYHVGSELVYGDAMSIQIALRLSETVVAYIDEQVASGRAKSRSEVVARFVERDRRRERSARDLEVLLADRSLPAVQEFDQLATVAGNTRLDLD
jgi:Arc/MetJ-type ribon-helix-helix transcriptional regulator